MSQGTYTEYLLLNKAEIPPQPDQHESGVRVYADADGVLHVLQSDGVDAEIGSGAGVQGIQAAVAHLSSADLLALDMTPFDLVAGVADKVIAPVLMLAHYRFGTVEYDDQAGSYSLFVGDDSGSAVWGTSLFSLCFGTEDRLTPSAFVESIDGNADVASAFAGKPFGISYEGGAIITGDGTLDVSIYYALLDLS